MLKRQFLSLAVVISFLSIPGVQAAWYDNEHTCLDKGRQAYQQGLFDQALRDLSDSLRFNPARAETYYWRGVTYVALKQWDKALLDLDHAIKLAPDNANCYMSRGLAQLSLKHYQEAVSDFDEALRLEPDLVDAQSNRKFAQKELEKTQLLAGSKPSSAAVQGTSIELGGTSGQASSLAELLKAKPAGKPAQPVNDPKWLALQAEIEAKVRREKMEEERLAIQRAKAEALAAGMAIKEKQAAEHLEAQRNKRELASAQRAGATQVATVKVDAGGASSETKENETSALEVVNRPVRDKWAVIIGISKFQDEKLNLNYPAKDATDFYNYLVKEANFAPDHVKLLTNEQATRGRILSEIGDKWLPRVANPDDLVLIYFSSHGSASDMDIGGVNYLLAYDSQVDSLYASGLPMQDLTRIIKGRVHSDRVVLVLDACHSGAAEAGTKGLFRKGNLDAEEVAQGTGQLVISSSSPSQVSWESKNYQNSVFTKCLIDSLRKKGNATTLGEAFANLKETVQEQVLRERGVMQTPVLKSRWKGNDLKISVPASSPRPGLTE